MPSILIVDDYAPIRAAVRERFESSLKSVNCDEAENGEEAITKARELKPDLIVLDLTMPIMDGFETAKALRDLFPTIPIVLLTAHYMEATRRAAQQVGIHAIFSKQQDLTPLIAHARALFQS